MWFLDRSALRKRFWQRQNMVAGHVSLNWDRWTIELVFADIAGRTECVGVALIGDGTERLTSSKWRKFPLTRLVQQTRRRAVSPTPATDINIELWTGSVAGLHEDPVAAIKGRVAKGLSASDRGRKWRDAAHYQKVADKYDFAFREGLDTTRYVQEECDLDTPGQARKHIWRARHEFGFLPPTDERIPKGNE